MRPDKATAPIGQIRARIAQDIRHHGGNNRN